MYKFVAVDLDGTMLNSYGEVTDNTRKAIKETINNGIDVVIASGRPIDSIKMIAKEIGSKNYFIAGNGALIYDIQNDEIIYDKYMNKEKVLEIIEFCDKNSISYNVYTSNTILTKSLKYNVLYYYKENLKREDERKTNISIVQNMYDYVKNMKEDTFLKITICDENKIVFNSIMKKVKKIKDVDILDISHMSRKMIKQGTEEIPIEYYYTEISSQNVDKWDAIEYLISRNNIKKQEVIAIGDNMNDKKMIENAGLGVAMKKSTPDVLIIADEIADSNNEEGVAKILQKMCK